MPGESRVAAPDEDLAHRPAPAASAAAAADSLPGGGQVAGRPAVGEMPARLPHGITSERAHQAYLAHRAAQMQSRAENTTAFDPASMGNGVLDQAASAMAHEAHDDSNEMGLKTGVKGGGVAAQAADLGVSATNLAPVGPLGVALAGKGLIRDAADAYRERDGGAHISSIARTQHDTKQEVQAVRAQYAAAEEFRGQHASEPRTEENADLHDLAGKLRGRANIAKARVGVLGGMRVDAAKRKEGLNSNPVREMTPSQQENFDAMAADPSKRDLGLADVVGTAAQGLRGSSEALEIASLAQIPLAGNTQKYVSSGQRGAAALSHGSDAAASLVSLAGPQARLISAGAGVAGVMAANAGQALASGPAAAQDDRDMAREKHDTLDQGNGLESVAERGFRPQHVEAQHPVLRTFEDPDKRGYLERMSDFASSTWGKVKSGAGAAWDAAASGLSAAGGAVVSGAQMLGRGAAAAGRGIAAGARAVGGAVATGARALGRGAVAAGRGLAAGMGWLGRTALGGIRAMAGAAGRLMGRDRGPA